MRLKYILGATFLLILIGLGIIFLHTAKDPEAIADFMNNSDISKPSLLVSLYNAGLIKNAVSLNTVLAVDNIKGLLLKGMGLNRDSQLLANPFVRYVKITEGTRKEEVAERVGTALGWTDAQKAEFETDVTSAEGKLYPETYLVAGSTDPNTMKDRLLQRFDSKVASQIKEISRGKITNLDTALKVASLIQREAAGKSDMNLISGIIWNRIFKGMDLDIDATLQYAKGNTDIGWWPKVTPADKSIQSPYNTYLNKGLPPTPISNPGIAAIQAAFNPESTKCIFYFHDKNRNIHCSVTYQEHVAKIKKYL